MIHRFSLRASLLLAVALGGCFPAPIDDLWPPRAGEPRVRLDVVYSDWHTLVVHRAGEENAFAGADAESERDGTPGESGAETARDTGRFIEWEFAEKAWYLEGRQGIFGVFRALFWPTTSALSRREVALPAWEREGRAAVERWRFVVSREGFERLLAYAREELGEPIGGREGWYEGQSSYHLFFLCHHFTLRALREAGLPVAPWWGFTAWQTGIQLDRVARFHEREGLGPE